MLQSVFRLRAKVCEYADSTNVGELVSSLVFSVSEFPSGDPKEQRSFDALFLPPPSFSFLARETSQSTSNDSTMDFTFVDN